MRRLNLLALAWAGLLAAQPAAAHGLDAGRMTIELEDTSLMVVVTPKVAHFEFADMSRDGRLDRVEVKAHRAQIRAAFDAAIAITDDLGAAPTCERTDVSTPVSGDSPLAATDHVRVTLRCRFAVAPTALRVRYAFASRGVVVVEAVRLRRPAPIAGRPSLPLRVGSSERVVLGSGDATARLLLVPGSNADSVTGASDLPPLAVGFGGFVRHGADHVLFGLDHILFIVALVLGTTRRRQLAAAVTSFTLTHTLALAAVIEGVIAAPSAAWVEPGIALSIALTAGLVAIRAAASPRPTAESAGWLCFTAALFGALHGLGMATTALETFADAASSMLVPFTLGAEVAQLAIAGLASVLAAALFDSGRAAAGGWRLGRQHAALSLVVVGVVWFALRATGDEAAGDQAVNTPASSG
ncbi:MAG: HupE/UreJ family protein [Myxococcales bacterium]|nr:HupE/UreJ family protein [Myxococcales bacterium]